MEFLQGIENVITGLVTLAGTTGGAVILFLSIGFFGVWQGVRAYRSHLDVRAQEISAERERADQEARQAETSGAVIRQITMFTGELVEVNKTFAKRLDAQETSLQTINNGLVAHDTSSAARLQAVQDDLAQLHEIAEGVRYLRSDSALLKTGLESLLSGLDTIETKIDALPGRIQTATRRDDILPEPVS